jgi:SET domain-containing protein
MARKYSWLNPKLYIKDTGKYGKGVFAGEEIKKGELCAIFGGHILSFKEEARLPQKYRDTGIQILDQFVISTILKKELADNFNHSCDPNAGINGQIFLVAMRRIKKKEQVTFDYAMCLTYNKKYAPYFYKTKCFCGSKDCRGFITANDWKIPGLQEKYKGFFSWYIQKRIDRL